MNARFHSNIDYWLDILTSEKTMAVGCTPDPESILFYPNTPCVVYAVEKYIYTLLLEIFVDCTAAPFPVTIIVNNNYTL